MKQSLREYQKSCKQSNERRMIQPTQDTFEYIKAINPDIRANINEYLKHSRFYSTIDNAEVSHNAQKSHDGPKSLLNKNTGLAVSGRKTYVLPSRKQKRNTFITQCDGIEGPLSNNVSDAESHVEEFEAVTSQRPQKAKGYVRFEEALDSAESSVFKNRGSRLPAIENSD